MFSKGGTSSNLFVLIMEFVLLFLQLRVLLLHRFESFLFLGQDFCLPIFEVFNEFAGKARRKEGQLITFDTQEFLDKNYLYFFLIKFIF